MFTEKTLSTIERPLPAEQIKKRPGRGNMTFDYIPTEFVIRLLNEAFNYQWSTHIQESFRDGSDVVVRLQLTVGTAEQSVVKEQYGSSAISGDLGDAYKAAASDALKKAATLLGIGLELYETVTPSTPVRAPAPSAAPPTTSASRPAPPAPRAALPLPAPVKDNPFSKDRAPAPRPAATPAAGVPMASLPRPMPARPAVPAPAERPNPFSKARQEAVGSTGPNSTQLNALTNIATRKNLSQSELIALASIRDNEENPVQSFEELTYEQAIKVIQAAQ